MLRRAHLSVAVSLTCLLAGTASLASAQRGVEQPPVLTAFAINGGSDSVSISEPAVALTHSIVGAPPSEYRVSHRAYFAGARWEPYTSSIAMRDWYESVGPPCDATRTSHRVTLFLQVRATLGEEVRVVDGQRQLVPSRNWNYSMICVPPFATGGNTLRWTVMVGRETYESQFASRKSEKRLTRYSVGEPDSV